MIAHAAPIAERKPARQHRHPRAARRTEQTQEQAVETGQVRRHLNIFVNSDNVRDLEGLDTALAAGDTLIILPAVSGG